MGSVDEMYNRDHHHRNSASAHCSTSASVPIKKSKADVIPNPATGLSGASLQWLEESYGIKCNMDTTCLDFLPSRIVPESSIMHSQFITTEFSDQILYMQPTEFDLQPHLQHYCNQKQQHPQLGAMLVMPTAWEHLVPTELQQFQLVHKFRGREYAFQDCNGRLVKANKVMGVYISRPAIQQGILVVSQAESESDLLFNLPCTIAGGKGTVHIDTKSLIDSGCGAQSLLSKRAVARLGLTPQPCSQTFALADGTLTNCLGQVTLQIKIQSHSFVVNAFVVDMNDAFDLVLGQQWLVN
jgi:hypothetical protein